ncbi:unnamed protein product, partial [Rotaria magnacalcarata]
EMQRIRKDSETSNSVYSAVCRGRRESERFRNELLASDNPNTVAHRNVPNQPAIREVIEFKNNINDAS